MEVLGGWCAQREQGSSTPLTLHPLCSLVLRISSPWLFLSSSLYDNRERLGKVWACVLWAALVIIRQRKSRERLTHRWPKTQNYNLTMLWGLSLWAVGSRVNISGCIVLEFPWIVEHLVGVWRIWRSCDKKHPTFGFRNIRKSSTSRCENEGWLGKLQFTLTPLLLFCVNYCQ